MLNGWQRLWMVVLIPITVFWIWVPVESWTERRPYPAKPSMEDRSLRFLNEYYKNGTPLPRLNKVDQKKKIQHYDRQVSEVRQHNETLTSQRILLVLTALGLWMVSGAALYLAGWLFAWVRRGFKGYTAPQ